MMSCGRTMGHGEQCTDGWECAQCMKIKDLTNVLKEAECVLKEVEVTKEWNGSIWTVLKMIQNVLKDN